MARQVGDPLFGRIRHLESVNFWVGDNSVANAPVNNGATGFVRRLLCDVRDGKDVTSDDEGEHVRQLLEHPDGTPVIHGPCLITGVDDDEPGELDENFQHWFSAVLEEMAQVRHAIAHLLADEIGIPADMVGRIVVIRLH